MKLLPAFYTIIIIVLFTMAYNNKKIYKRKYMTSVYVIVGIFITVTTLIEYVF